MRMCRIESFVSAGPRRRRCALSWLLNAALFVLFWLAGAGNLVLIRASGLVATMATWLSLVTRIRNIAEHACPTTTGPKNPFSHARHPRSPNPVERLFIAPYLGELSRRASSLHVPAPATGCPERRTGC